MDCLFFSRYFIPNSNILSRRNISIGKLWDIAVGYKMSCMKERRKNIAGKNIRKWRLRKNLTQEKLALESGLSQGYLNQLESGKKGFSEGRLQDIAAALGVPISALFEEEEKNDYCSREPRKKVCQKADKKELWRLFNKLPEHIAEHYMLLMKMEMDILEGKHLTLEKSHDVR